MFTASIMLFGCAAKHDTVNQERSLIDSQQSAFQLLKSEGRLLGQKKKYFQAIAKLDQAVVLEPNDPHVHLMLGEAYFHIGNEWASLAHLERSRELAPNNYQIETWIGTINIELGQLSRAAEAYSKVLMLKPNDYNALVYMGYIAFHRKDYRTCQSYFERYKKLVDVIEPARLTEQEKLRYQQATEYHQACNTNQDNELIEQANAL